MEVLIGYMIDGRNSGIDKYLLRVLRVFMMQVYTRTFSQERIM